MASAHDFMHIWLDKTVYRKDYFALHPEAHDAEDIMEMQPPKCPHCGSSHTAVVQYGRPIFSDELDRLLGSGQIILGGCCIDETSSKFYCHDCKKRFGAPPIFDGSQGIEDYRDILASVRFLDGGYFEGYPEVTIRHTQSVSQAEVIPPHSFKEEMIVIPVSDAEWNAVAYALFNRLFIHEWEDESYCDPTICDGEQWELSLCMERGHGCSFSGSNAFPAYWEELKDVFRPYFEKAVIRLY